ALLIQMHNNFGIAVGVEAVATGLEFAAQLGEIVDLAVENDPDRLVFVVDGLLATGEVDDAEAAHAEAYGATNVDALVSGVAVNDRLAHALDGLGRDDVSRTFDHFCYLAHWLTSLSTCDSDVCLTAGLRPCTVMGCSITRRSSSSHASNQRKTSS